MALLSNFGGLPRPQLRCKSDALIEPLEVTVDRGAVDSEPAGGLALEMHLLTDSTILQRLAVRLHQGQP